MRTRPYYFFYVLGAGIIVALADAWLTQQQLRISALEIREKALRARTAGAGRPGEHPQQMSARDHDGPLPLKDGGIDWTRLAGLYRGGIGVAQPEFEKRLLGLSAAELLAEYRRLCAAPMDSESERSQLGVEIAAAMAEKDPQLALETFGDRLTISSNQWLVALAAAVRRLAKDDPAKAAGWIDAQVAAGRLNDGSGEGYSRLFLESSLVRSALTADPALAGQRVAAFPRSVRMNFFLSEGLLSLAPEEMPVMVGLWRESMSPDEQHFVLRSAAQKASAETDGDMGGMAAWLQAAEPDAEIRSRVWNDCVYNSIAKILPAGPEQTAERLTYLNDLARGQLPEDAGKVISTAVQSIAYKLSLETAAGMIGQLQGGTDYQERILVELLTSQAGKNEMETAQKLAAGISAPELRQSVLDRLAGHKP